MELRLDGAAHGLIDTTHFDVTRFPPPDWALPAFVGAAESGAAAYTAYRGGPDVRGRCADAISALLDVDVDPERNLVLTTGTQGGLFAVLSALVDAGDRVALTDPEYLFAERILRFLGAEVVRIPLRAGGDPGVDLQQLEDAAIRGIRLFLTSNPNNPTGTVYSDDTVKGISRLAAAHDFLVVVDELYCRLVYDETPFTHLAAEPEMGTRTVTLLGGSKTESLTGYRVGAVVADAEIIDAIEQVIAFSALRAPAYSQHVLTGWLHEDDDFVRERVRQLRIMQRHATDRLRSVPGISVEPGAGTAYLWPDVSGLGLTSLDAGRLCYDAGVVVSPGYQFGPSGKTRFRMCFAQDEARLDAALDRITAALADASYREIHEEVPDGGRDAQ
ncbi:MAG: aminotransferase class I/II-fold pyridoxal phosphate-dependent enzyme [Streptosporangiaceae bacterium]